MNYKEITIINLLLFLFCSLSAQNESETRTYMKTLPVSRETSLELTNKYGNVYITPWDKDSASIKGEIKAFAPNEAKIKKMFDGISVNINESDFLIRVSTDFVTNINVLFEEFKGLTSKLKLYDSHIEINYYLNIPDYLNLKINNKYGNLFIENSEGNLSISVSNGSLKAGSLGKKSDITMTFCNASIKSVASGKIDAYFSEIEIEEAGRISINSVSSRYDIKKAEEINFESRRDKFFIGTALSLSGSAYFTDFDIKTLKKGTDITTRYGNLTASIIEAGFEELIINSGYSDISLNFDQEASYKLEIRNTNSYLVLPSKNTETEKRILDEGKKEYTVSGSVGKSPGSSKVKISATRGNIYLK